MQQPTGFPAAPLSGGGIFAISNNSNMIIRKG